MNRARQHKLELEKAPLLVLALAILVGCEHRAAAAAEMRHGPVKASLVAARLETHSPSI